MPVISSVADHWGSDCWRRRN